MDLRLRQMSAVEARHDEGLPENGRGIEDVTRMETILRDVLDREIPVYDLHPSADPFKPLCWSYTDGAGLLIMRPNYVELALRLVLLAAQVEAEPTISASRLIAGLSDKWVPDDPDPPPEACVFFPPGRNFLSLIHWDNVEREFDREPLWSIKPHPVGGTPEYIDEVYVQPFGANRVLSATASGWKLMQDATKVGYTTASELGVAARVMGKETVDFTRHSHAAHGNYYPLYRAMEDGGPEAFERVINCPWSGHIPLELDDDEARFRMVATIEKAHELDRTYRPLVDLPPLDEHHD